ncbi:MAG: hypothetical protein Kow0069_03620 [Promethearchaeota archaeon]
MHANLDVDLGNGPGGGPEPSALLLTTLGTSPEVVVEAFWALAERQVYENRKGLGGLPEVTGLVEVWALGSEKSATGPSGKILVEWVRSRDPPPFKLRVFGVRGTSDFVGRGENERFREAAFRLAAAAHKWRAAGGTGGGVAGERRPSGRTFAACLSGGTKTMSVFLQEACSTYRCDFAIHVLADDEFNDARGQLNYLKRPLAEKLDLLRGELNAHLHPLGMALNTSPGDFLRLLEEKLAGRAPPWDCPVPGCGDAVGDPALLDLGDVDQAGWISKAVDELTLEFYSEASAFKNGLAAARGRRPSRNFPELLFLGAEELERLFASEVPAEPSEDWERFLNRVPKADLHCHLGGAAFPGDLVEIALANLEHFREAGRGEALERLGGTSFFGRLGAAVGEAAGAGADGGAAARRFEWLRAAVGEDADESSVRVGPGRLLGALASSEDLRTAWFGNGANPRGTRAGGPSGDPGDPEEATYLCAVLSCFLAAFKGREWLLEELLDGFVEGELGRQRTGGGAAKAGGFGRRGTGLPPLLGAGLGQQLYFSWGDWGGTPLLQTERGLRKAVACLYGRAVEDGVGVLEVRFSPLNYCREWGEGGPLRVVHVVQDEFANQLRRAFGARGEAGVDPREAATGGEKIGEPAKAVDLLGWNDWPKEPDHDVFGASPAGVPCLVTLTIIASKHKDLEEFRRNVELVRELRRSGGGRTVSFGNLTTRFGQVVAFDLAGPEIENLEAFREALRPLHEESFGITVHAGEGAPVENVWKAIYELNADRVGHGLSLGKDDGLVRKVADRRIAVELCPTSNSQLLGYGGSGEEAPVNPYPYERFREMGVTCTVNTDNRGISRTSLAREFFTLAWLTRGSGSRLLAWDVLQLAWNGVEASFLSAEDRLLVEGLFGRAALAACQHLPRNPG